jgi:PAS domain S-box-containing protein
MKTDEPGSATHRPHYECMMRSMFQVTDEGFWEWDLASRHFWLNPFFSQLVGIKSDEAIMDAETFASIIHPDDRQAFFDDVLAGVSQQTTTTLSLFRIISKSGYTHWIESKSHVVDFNEDGSPHRIFGHIDDITKRRLADKQLKKLNRNLLAISQCNQALLRATNEKELLDEICRIVVEVGGYRMAWVGYAEDDPEKTVRPVARTGFVEGYLDTVKISWDNDVAIGKGTTGTAIRTGKNFLISDTQTSPLFAPWREEAAKRGYHSILALPLIDNNRVFGALTIYSGTKRAFNAEEIRLLSSLAENMAYGISMLQNRKARELAEEELRQSEQRYRSLFQNRHVVMLMIDPLSGSIIDANPAAENYYGWNREQLCRMNINEITTLTEAEIKAEMKKASEMDCKFFSFRHRLADGSIRDVEVVSGPFAIQGKSLLYSIINDVTERNIAQSKLVEGNRQMRFILATANAGLWETGIEGNATTWSDEVWKLYNLEPGSCPPSYESWLNSIISDDQEMIKTEAEAAVMNGTDFNCTFRVRNPDGAIRWLLSKGTPFKDTDGKMLGFRGIVIDITDRKREEEEKNQLQSRLLRTQRLETIGTLAGGIAHDFNNILTPILGYSEMGLLTFTGDDTIQEYFHEIMLAADRARNLVSQILAFSRAQEITPSVMSVPDVIDEALKLLRPSIPASITIDKEIERTCGNILADPSQIHQVIVNLCTNAYQAMGDATGTIHIALEEVVPEKNLLKSLPEPHSNRYVQLSISDTGIGMDNATMERIFEPFFTTKSAQKGTGLGLSVVHGIITGFNGLITVNSTPARGTAFRIYLPVIDAHPELDESIPHLATGNASIMFVDDEPASTRMITIMLEKLGFSIQTFNSPQEALDCFRRAPFRFDLVITDLTMPVINGVDLASELHAVRPQLPIILMTGYGKDLENIRSTHWHGIRRFIKKPVKMVELSTTIDEVLKSSARSED